MDRKHGQVPTILMVTMNDEGAPPLFYGSNGLLKLVGERSGSEGVEQESSYRLQSLNWHGIPKRGTKSNKQGGAEYLSWISKGKWAGEMVEFCP
jgi:hypothetical protein